MGHVTRSEAAMQSGSCSLMLTGLERGLELLSERIELDALTEPPQILDDCL